MDKPTETSLAIKEHDFQEAKTSLKKYTERAKREIDIHPVPTRGGLFNLGKHPVTGTELNEIISEIEMYLINLNELNQGLVDEFGQVYKAFESLDKDYISGIVRSIQTAEKVSLDEQKDRADIKKLVQNLNIAVIALKKFKEDIEKIKHLMDVDAAYELIEEQERLIKALCDYRDELSTLKHIKDVDMLWDAKESQAKTLENINKKIDIIDETIESQCNAISEFAVLIDQKYQSFVGTATKTLDEKQAAIDRRFDSREKAIQANFSDLRNSVIKAQEAQNNRIDDLSKSQMEKFFSIENAQAEKLGQIAENQSSALDAMKKAQDDLFAQISNEQSEMLAQISREQVEWLESTNKSLEEEKASLKENITALTQKVKTAYIVAGGAAVVTVVHMVLSILGVL